MHVSLFTIVHKLRMSQLFSVNFVCFTNSQTVQLLLSFQRIQLCISVVVFLKKGSKTPRIDKYNLRVMNSFQVVQKTIEANGVIEPSVAMTLLTVD
ncbi:Uncharacterised protein [Chlamydia trachomatis]|nr:Uncharacterised protein [Chlamydia trachomatis]